MTCYLGKTSPFLGRHGRFIHSLERPAYVTMLQWEPSNIVSVKVLGELLRFTKITSSSCWLS